MELTNKASITIAPKKPFINWARSMSFISYSEEDMNEYECYLVDIEDAADEDEILQAYYEKLFEEQLILIGQPESWPQNRSYELFNSWFSTYISFDVQNLDNEDEEEEDEESQESEVKDEAYYQKLVAEEIREIANQEQNQEQAKRFWETLEGIKPKSCIVKSGWFVGKSISILMAFEKGGEEDPYALFTKNIGDAAETYGFLQGLSPEIFYIAHPMAIENETHHFIDIKLKRHGQDES